MAYTVLQSQVPSYLEELPAPYHHISLPCSQNSGLLVVHRISKSKMGGTSSLSRYERLTLSLLLRYLKPSSLRNDSHYCSLTNYHRQESHHQGR